MRRALSIAPMLMVAVTSVLMIAGALALIPSGAALAQEYHWYKGQTHAHTNLSDGNETPRRVVRWYVDHSYNFLVISDHNLLTDPTSLDSDKNDDFILIPGEEVTDRAEGKPCHENAIGIRSLVEPKHGKTIVETLQNNADAIRAAGGLTIVNHPNWHYAFGASELSAISGLKLVEIYNVPKESNNYAAGGAPGTEEIWDALLSRGKLVYGVCSDDAHTFSGEFSADTDNPGKGWIVVRAKELTPAAILSAIEKGDFYGSIGVTLKDVTITDKDYTVEIAPWQDSKYTTLFIGKDGTVLARNNELKATYHYSGNEGYVRAKVISSTGDFALTQPVFVPAAAR